IADAFLEPGEGEAAGRVDELVVGLDDVLVAGEIGADERHPTAVCAADRVGDRLERHVGGGQGVVVLVDGGVAARVAREDDVLAVRGELQVIDGHEGAANGLAVLVDLQAAAVVGDVGDVLAVAAVHDVSNGRLGGAYGGDHREGGQQVTVF